MTGKACFVVACVLWVVTGARFGAQGSPEEIAFTALLAIINTVCALKLLKEAP